MPPSIGKSLDWAISLINKSPPFPLVNGFRLELSISPKPGIGIRPSTQCNRVVVKVIDTDIEGTAQAGKQSEIIDESSRSLVQGTRAIPHVAGQVFHHHDDVEIDSTAGP